MTLPASGRGVSHSLSQREKPGLDLEGEVPRTGRGTQPSGQEGSANKGPSKLRGPAGVEGGCQTVSVTGTGANVDPSLIPCHVLF